MPDGTKNFQETRLLETQHPSPIHYLENPEIINFIGKISPELLPDLQEAIKPTVSNNPDTLELWEMKKRQERTDNLSLESPQDSLRKLLYEEFFGVTATPGIDELYLESTAPTTGGLITHYTPDITDWENKIKNVIQLPLNKGNIVEIIDGLPTIEQKDILATLISEIRHPSFKLTWMERRDKETIRHKLVKKPTLLINRDDLNSIPLRYIQIIKTNPSLLKKIEDKKLSAIPGVPPSGELSKLQYLVYLWQRMQSKILDGASYRSPSTLEDTERINNATKVLLAIRTHPEFQFMFKYFSPSGHINEQREN